MFTSNKLSEIPINKLAKNRAYRANNKLPIILSKKLIGLKIIGKSWDIYIIAANTK